MCDDIPCKPPKDAHPRWLKLRDLVKALRFPTRWAIIEFIGEGVKSTTEIYEHLIGRGERGPRIPAVFQRGVPVFHLSSRPVSDHHSTGAGPALRAKQAGKPAAGVRSPENRGGSDGVYPGRVNP